MDLKDWLLFFEVWFKSGDAFEPVVEQFVAGLVQTFAYLVASLFKFDTFLLGFPGCSENQRHFVLVKLQFVVEIIHPHNFVYDIRQITGFVKSFIHLILVEQLRFKFVNVFVHLIQELALAIIWLKSEKIWSMSLAVTAFESLFFRNWISCYSTLEIAIS